MNEARKEKLKRLILKLPFGLQLLQLRRKIISQHQVRKREMKLRRKAKEREIMLRRKEKRQTRMLRYKIKKSEIAEKERLQQVKLKTKIRQKKVPLIQKNLLWHKASLSYSGFYRYRSTEILDIFQRYSHVPLEQATAFEIGTGVYLSAPIGLSLLGFQKVITIDIRRAVPKYVQMVLKYYQKHGTNLGITRCPKIKAKLTDENLDSILLNHFNIDYRAPYDAAHTDLPDNSVDYVFSQETFEHIRTEILHDIVNEAFRILHGGGVMYVDIIYEDHRSYKNPKINCYDHFQYTKTEWSQYNTGLYHNRLLTPDYRDIFATAGFEIIEFKSNVITDADRAAFATVKVADEFKNKYTDEEMMERKVRFILRKP